MYNFFAYLSRMRYIERWSLMRNALPENIQEHSHQVAVIAHALGIIRRDVLQIPCNPEEYAAVALYHDCSEILTGDLPTPIKYHSAKIKGAYDEVEQLACEKLLSTLPEQMRGAFEPYLNGSSARRCHDLVKAADKPATATLSPPSAAPVRRWRLTTCRRWTTSCCISSPPSS